MSGNRETMQFPPGVPGSTPGTASLSGVCCEGGCARPCPGWRFTRLSPIIQHPAGLWRRPKAWPASHSQIVAASVERPDTMCTDTQSRVLLPSEKKKKKKDKDKAAEPEAQPDHHRVRSRARGVFCALPLVPFFPAVARPRAPSSFFGIRGFLPVFL